MTDDSNPIYFSKEGYNYNPLGTYFAQTFSSISIHNIMYTVCR